jgi:hypothetical protein
MASWVGSAAGTIARGDAITVFLITEKRNVHAMSVSIAVPVISPSPWAMWPSPAENLAPAAYTGNCSRVPLTSCRTSLLPPIPPLTLGGNVRYMPLRIGALPRMPINGERGIRACRPVSLPTKVATPVFCPRSK